MGDVILAVVLFALTFPASNYHEGDKRYFVWAVVAWVLWTVLAFKLFLTVYGVCQ